MKKVIQALVIIDIGILLFCFLSGNREWLFNTQIGFVSSTLIMFASIVSYRNMVQHRVEMGMVVAEDNRDTLEKIEDPYDVFGEDEPIKEEGADSFKEVIQEEREKLKKSRRSLWQVTKDSKASLSFYRLGAYGLLIFGFFYLNKNGLLDIPSYLLALSLPPVVVVLMLMRQK